MTGATVRTLRPRPGNSDRSAHDHPVTAKLASADFDVLTALSLIDRTGPADQIRSALDYYFTFRLSDPAAIQAGIARARARQEAALAVLISNSASRSVPDGVDDEERVDGERPRLDKPVTLRVQSRAFDQLTAFALVDEVSLADALRSAIQWYIAYRKDDPDLHKALQQARAKYDTTMAVLATGSE